MTTSRKKRDRVGIRQLKNETSRVVREVREQGSEYVVTQHGRPVALIRPWTKEDEVAADRRAAQEALHSLLRAAHDAEAALTSGGAVEAVTEQRR